MNSQLNFDSFNRDGLELKGYAMNIIEIIQKCHLFPKSNDNEAYVMAIDSSWGTGKTYFDKIIIQFLNDNRNIKNINTIYYDAWSNDFWNNAFEPLFAQIIGSKLLEKETVKSDIADMLKSAGKIIALGIKGVATKKIEDFIDTAAVDDMISEYRKIWDNTFDSEHQVTKYFKEFSEFKNAISVLKVILRKATENNGGKTVIFIDELDRCKPTFAIQTLEIVKHLFNIKGLVFVFSLDLEQLSYCVQSVYGENINSIGYLERFFNFISSLPKVDYLQIVKRYIDEFNIIHNNECFCGAVNSICQIFDLTLRDLRTVLSALYILQQTSLKVYCNNDDATILYLYFLTMKYKYPSFLNNALRNNNYSNLLKFLRENKVPFILEDIEIDGDIIVSKIGDSQYDLIQNIDDMYMSTLQSVRCFKSQNGCTVLKDALQNEISLASNECLSFLLFFEDVRNINNISEYTVLNYISKNLELCGFVYE